MANNQRWKTDRSLSDCKRQTFGLQEKKVLDYKKTYVKEFLDSDPLRDWESIKRCQKLFIWALEKIGYDLKCNLFDSEKMEKLGEICDWSVLDCGTKDGQFPEWLIKEGGIKKSIGIEISEEYVKYAQSKNRPVTYGDVCDLPKGWSGRYDMVFSHHLLGLCPDYKAGLSEMWRVTKPGGYMITLNDVPGNPRKHYSLIHDGNIFLKFIDEHESEIEYVYHVGYWSDEYPKEWVLFLEKKK